MDKLYIKSLQLQTTIGCLKWEQQILQTVLLSLELGVVIDDRDVIDATVDYAQLAEKLTQFAQRHQCQLIETLAEKLAQFIRAHYPSVKWLKLALEKPGAVARAQTVGIVIERSYE